MTTANILPNPAENAPPALQPSEAPNSDQKADASPVTPMAPSVIVALPSRDSKIKSSKDSLDSRQQGKEKKSGNKEHKFLHLMFHHGADKDKDGDDSSGKAANKKSKADSSKLSPYTSYDSDGASSGSSQLERSRPSSPHTHFVINNDGTHFHDLQHMGKKENQIMQIFHREGKGRYHLHLPLFGHDGSDRNNSKPTRSSSQQNLTEKYGACREICGKGAFGVVRVAHKYEDRREHLYAVKEFKKRESDSQRTYKKRLFSEFCISSTLIHTNIVKTLDLLPVGESSERYAEVMEFCDGGDVFGLVNEFGSLQRDEANCFFKQLVNGVGYLHAMGVAHRDLKPENLLLTSDGCLKITDFGNSECFRVPWESESRGVHTSKGVCGSGPYIAPEEFTEEEFDPRLVDIWSVGVVYVAILTGRHLWHIARAAEDELFRTYVEIRKNMKERVELEKQGKKAPSGKVYGVEVIDKLEEGPRRLIYGMLEPNPRRRLTIADIQKDEFFQNIWTCHPPEGNMADRKSAIKAST